MAHGRRALLRAAVWVRMTFGKTHARFAPGAEVARIVKEAGLFAALLVLAFLLGFAFMIIAAD